MKKINLLIIFIVVLSNSILAQNPRKENPVGLNFQIGGPGFVTSASIDVFVIPKLNVEVGIGFFATKIFIGDGNIFGGLKYHFYGNTENKVTPYIGAFFSQISVINYHGKTKNISELYVPIGVQFLSSKGFTMSIEAAAVHEKTKELQMEVISAYFGFKIGFHLGKDKSDTGRYHRTKSTYKDEDYRYYEN